MSWIVLTFLSVISRALYGVTTKVLSSRVTTSVYTQAALLSFACALVSLCFSPLLGGIVFADIFNHFVVAFTVAASQGIGNIIYFVAIKRLTNGTAQIACSSILIFNTLLALIFLNLHLSIVNVIGITLLLVAILSVSKDSIEFDTKGVALMICAAFLFSIFQISSAELSNLTTAATYLFVAYAGAALVVFIMKAREVMHDISNITQYQTVFGIPFLAAIPSIGNFLFAYYAYRLSPEPGKVAILLTSQVVVSVLFSYWLLKEHNHLAKKLLAAILVIFSAILIMR